MPETFHPGQRVTATFSRRNHYTGAWEVVTVTGTIRRWHRQVDSLDRPTGPATDAMGNRPLELKDRSGRTHWICVTDDELSHLNGEQA